MLKHIKTKKTFPTSLPNPRITCPFTSQAAGRRGLQELQEPQEPQVPQEPRQLSATAACQDTANQIGKNSYSASILHAHEHPLKHPFNLCVQIRYNSRTERFSREKEGSPYMASHGKNGISHLQLNLSTRFRSRSQGLKYIQNVLMPSSVSELLIT